jgi:hypothetical protein
MINDRDNAVLRAKVTITKEQLTEIIKTFNDGMWGENWEVLPSNAVELWLPLDQVEIDDVVLYPDAHSFIAL